jgi:hypothetical protein
MKSLIKVIMICSLFMFVLFTTCDGAIGLGEKVVTLAPTIDTKGDSTNPDSKAPGDFLSGAENYIYINADSEGEVVDVFITYYYYDENGVEQTIRVSAVEDKDINQWVANIDTTDLPDGKIRVKITAVDFAERETTSTDIIYTVKNKPPFINMLIPNVTQNLDKPDEYLTKQFDNSEPPTVVMDSYLSGVYDDIAGIAQGYPKMKFWKEGYSEPVADNRNAGYENVIELDDDPNDGWINVDDGLVKIDKGAQAGSFRYYLRNHKSDGKWFNQSEKEALNTGFYNLKLLVKDITGKEIEWPKDAYTWADGTPDANKYMKIKIIDQGLPPQVVITSPTAIYLRENFEIKANAVSSGDRNIVEWYLEVEGKEIKDGSNKKLVTLAKQIDPDSDSLIALIEKEIKIGKTYYSLNEEDTAIEVDNESLVPFGAYSSVTFEDGNFNFSVRAKSSEGAEGMDIKSIYIDRTPPKTEITRVSPNYSLDSVALYQAEDLPAGWPLVGSVEPYRRWTVNSTVEIDVSTTDNRGNAIDDINNYIKFKYLFLKDSDINDTVYSSFIENGNLNRYGFSKYLYDRTDAKFFEDTVKNPIPVPTENIPNGNPLIKVKGEDGAYTLTLQTRKYDTREKYKLWVYIAALDNAGNANFQKILLNVDQSTDLPRITIGNINPEGSLNGYTFMDDKYGIRFTVIDDNGLNVNTSVEVRFAVDETEKTSMTANASAGWFALPGAVTNDGSISEDGLSISVNNLTLLEIACRLVKSSYLGTEKLEDEYSSGKTYKEKLGPEDAVTYIQIRATDSADGKIYSSDGTYSKTSEWMPFRIDLTYPQIVPSTKDLPGVTITRNDDNPFGAPEKEKAYNQTFAAYGDIIEQNFSYIQLKIDGKNTKEYRDYEFSVPGYSSTQPLGTGFAVWKTVNGSSWAGELRFRIPMNEFFTPLQDGSHTFEISFFDKANQYVTSTITFYKDTKGPNIDVIIPSGEKTYNASSITPQLLGNSIKDKNAKLIGSFNDAYSPVYSADNNKYWYTISNTSSVSVVPWTNVIMTGDITESKSTAWQIPIDESLQDGIYLLSLRVKDSHGNGYSNADSVAGDSGEGYLNNLSFMLDRNIPQFKDVTVELEQQDGKTGFTVKGKITDTYSANDFEVIIKDKSKTKTGTGISPGGDRAFTFNYWVQTQGDGDYDYGSNNVTISVTGSSGQSAIKTLSFILDNRGPEISFNTTGGEKIILGNTEIGAISAVNVDDSAWTSEYFEFLYGTRIKDRSASAKLSGRFSDDYTPIPATDGKYTFRYKIYGPGNESSGSWKPPVQMTSATPSSKSVPWEIPIPAEMEDGIYRLTIGVSDRIGNGYGTSDPLNLAVADYGYEVNMAFMVDRSAPELDAALSGNTVLGKTESTTLTGTVSGTYAIQSLSMSINNVTPVTLPFAASTFKEFTIPGKILYAADLSHGRQNIVISATGSSDQIGSVTKSFIVDKEGPEVTINGKSKIYESGNALGVGNTVASLNTGLNNGSVNPRLWTGNLATIYNERLKDNSAKLTLSIYDEFSPPVSLDTFEYQINGGGFKTATISTLDIPWSALLHESQIIEGLNKLDVRVSDKKSNQTTETGIVFMVDRKVPVLEVISGIEQNSIYGGSSDITIEGVVKNVFDVSRLTLLFNGLELEVKGTETGSFLNYDSIELGFPFQFSIPKNIFTYGTQSVLISAVGSSGQSKMENYNIVIDTKGPKIDVNKPSGEIYNAGSITQQLLENSIKDTNAYLNGSFNDEYASVFSTTNDKFWYKISDVNGADAVPWQSITGDTINSKSSAWQILLSETLPDGIYLLSLRVKDSLGNGYSNADNTIPGNSGEGYQNNLAFLLDRKTPKLAVENVQVTQVNGKTGFYLVGKITDTFKINSFDVRIGDKIKSAAWEPPVQLAGEEREFAFDYWVQTQGDSDYIYGSNTITISVTGSSGQSAVSTQSFILDNRGPEISFNTTGGQKIVLDDTDVSALIGVNVNNPTWADYRNFLYGTRIKDRSASAKISGRFSDEYTAITDGEGKYTFRYKIDGPGNGKTGSWQSIEMTTTSPNSKSVPWEITLPVPTPPPLTPTDKEDGIYRLTIGVSDRIGNGYATSDPSNLDDADFGYEVNMAYMLDRSAPVLAVTGITEGKVYKKTDVITLTGTVSATYAVQNLYMSIDGGEPETLPFTVLTAKTFAITNKAITAGDLAHGRHNIVISATGSSDQIASETYNFIVDKEGPVVTINGRSKIYESGDAPNIGNTVTSLNTSLNNGTVNPRTWTGNLATIYNERLKDNSAKITLSIFDEFSQPGSEDTFEYQINGGGWQTPTISNLDIPWSAALHTAHVIEGLNKLDVKVSDKQGNLTTETGIVFMVDRKTPVLEVSGVEQNGIYGGSDIIVTGVVKNVYDVTRVSLLFNGIELDSKGTEVAKLTSEPDIKPGSFDPALNYLYYDNLKLGFPFQFSISADSLVHGTQSVLVSALGSSGQSKMNSYNIIIDNHGPEIKFMTTDNPIYLSDDEFLTLYKYFVKGQGSLLPGLDAKNLLLGTSAIKDISARLMGNFIDDYSFVYEMSNYGYWYKIDKINETSVLIENGTWIWTPIANTTPDSTSAGWNISLPTELLVDGYYRVSLRVKDRLGNGYTSSDLNTTEGGGGYGFQNNMGFMIERSIPKITVAEVPSFINKDLNVTGTITDTTSVSAMNITMGGIRIGYIDKDESGNTVTNNVTLTPAGAKSFNFSFNIPTTGLLETSYSVMVTVVGASGQSAMEVRNFIFDKTPPKVTFNSPTVGTTVTSNNGNLSDNGVYSIWWSGSWVTGDVKIGGMTDDKNGVNEIYYHIGKLTNNSLDGVDSAAREIAYNNAVWTNTNLDKDTSEFTNGWTGGLYYWNYTESLNHYMEEGQDIEKTDENGIGFPLANMFYLPFYVKVVDRAGNINIVHYKVYVDPDADIPHASIENPSNGVRVGGEVRISGTAVDNTWVHSVDIRIYDTVRGTYYRSSTDDEWVDGAANGWVKAKITGNTASNVSWYYTVNADGELNPPAGMSDRLVLVEVRAWDTKDLLHEEPSLVGSPSTAFNYYFDSGVPTISIPIITKTGNSPREYIDGIKVSGKFKISADVKDDGGISLIRARLTGNSLFTEIVRDNAVLTANLKTGWQVFPPSTVAQNLWQTGWRYYIVNMGTMNTNSDWSAIDVDYEAGKTYGIGTVIKYKGGAVNRGASAMQADGTRVNTPFNAADPDWNTQFFKYTVEFEIDSTNVVNSNSVKFLDYGKTGIYTLELDVYDNNKQPAPYNTRGTYNMGVDNYYPTAEITTQYNATTENFYVMGTAKDYDSQSGGQQGLARMLVYFQRGSTYYNARGVAAGTGDPFYNGKGYVDDSNRNWANNGVTMITYPIVMNRDTRQDITNYIPNVTDYANFPYLKMINKGTNLGDVGESPHAMVIDGMENGANTDTDGDGTFAEQWEGRVDVTWQARLDTTKFTDGPITVHYIIMDQAGNATHYSDDIYIGNNRPLIRNINMGTDIKGNGSVTDWTSSTNFGDYMPNPITIGETTTGNAEIRTDFRVRNSRFGLRLDALYGNGTKRYKVSYVTRNPGTVQSTDMVRGTVYTISDPGNTDWTKYGALNNNENTTFVASGKARATNDKGIPTTGSVYSYTYPGGTAEKTGNFGVNEYITTGAFDNFALMPDTVGKTYDADGNMNLLHDKLFIVKVFDSTVSVTAGQEFIPTNEMQQLAHVALFNVDFDNSDGQKPLVVINPFRWTSASDNSLYENSRDNGHIELPADLPASPFNQTTGIYDRDPKVSGKVSFRGTVYDNIIISKIYFAVTNHSNYGLTGTTLTGVTGTYYLAASFNSGSWTVEGDSRFTNNGWKFTVEKESLGQEGHSIEWKLDYDSSFITNKASADITLTVIAQDSKPTTPNNSDAKNYRFDIVPYISKITTRLSAADNRNPSVYNRSAQGWYPTHEDEVITIEGFNLYNTGSPSVDIRQTANATAIVAPLHTVTGTGGITGAHSAARVYARIDNNGNDDTTNSITSGYLVVRVNGIDSINNVNSSAVYNSEANGVNNDNLTDDRAIYVWNTGYITNMDVSRMSHPVMRMANDGTRLLSYGYYLGSSSGRLKVLRNNLLIDAGLGRSNRVLNTTVATGGTNASWYAAGSDQSSDTNRGFQFGRSNPTGSQNGTNNAVTIGDNATTGYISLITGMESSNANRFRFPRIAVQPTAASGNRTNTYADRILISYFDEKNKEIQIIYGNVGDSTGSQTNGIGGIPHVATGNDFRPYVAQVVTSEGVNGVSATTHKGSQYTATGFFTNGLPVIAWYDRSNQNVVLSWGNDTPTTTDYSLETSRMKIPSRDYELNSHGLTGGTTNADIVLAGSGTSPAVKYYVTVVNSNRFRLNVSATSSEGMDVGDTVNFITHISVPTASGTNNSGTTGNTQFYTFPSGHGLAEGDYVMVMYENAAPVRYYVRNVAANGANSNIKFTIASYATHTTTSTAAQFLGAGENLAPTLNQIFVYPEKSIKTAVGTSTTNVWQSNAVIIDSSKGTHVDMVIDGANNIHLAYFDHGSGGLWYVLIPPTNGTNTNSRPNVTKNESDYATNVTPVKLDTYQAAGVKLMINVRYEGTRYVPYISYGHQSLSETKNSIRVAWRTNFDTPNVAPAGSHENDSLTGAWEVMTVPVSSNVTPSITDDFVCNGVPTSTTGWETPAATPTANGGISTVASTLRAYSTLNKSIILGYMTDTWYEGAILKKDLW